MRRALAFLTPLGGARAPSPAALPWFPVVGAVVGLGVGLVWWGAVQVWPPALAAALTVSADLGFTGMLHLDGLVDAADGLLPHLETTRRLEVMAEPGAGAFGVGAAVTVLLVRWAALTGLEPQPLLVAALWCASRSAMAATVGLLPYARSSGLATAFLPEAGRRLTAAPAVVGVAGLVAAGGLAAAVASLVAGTAAIVGVVVGAGAVVAFARRRIGGFTGDVLGAAGLVGETAGLVLAAARW
jgi:adenosylcobinamide-GDP ribazoletransferase